MTERGGSLDWLIGPDVAATFLVLVGVVAVSALVRIQAVQIPGYLVLVGFDLLQNPLAPDLSGSAFSAAFAAYLYGLAGVLAAISRVGRSAVGEMRS